MTDFKAEKNVGWKACACGAKPVTECVSCNEFTCDECTAGTIGDTDMPICHGCVIESLLEGDPCEI